MGVLLMVFATLTILIAHAGFGLPVIMEITRVFEAPDETINYESSVIHWFFQPVRSKKEAGNTMLSCIDSALLTSY
jgi:hypothetical protein